MTGLSRLLRLQRRAWIMLLPSSLIGISYVSSDQFPMGFSSTGDTNPFMLQPISQLQPSGAVGTANVLPFNEATLSQLLALGLKTYYSQLGGQASPAQSSPSDGTLDNQKTNSQQVTTEQDPNSVTAEDPDSQSNTKEQNGTESIQTYPSPSDSVDSNGENNVADPDSETTSNSSGTQQVPEDPGYSEATEAPEAESDSPSPGGSSQNPPTQNMAPGGNAIQSTVVPDNTKEIPSANETIVSESVPGSSQMSDGRTMESGSFRGRNDLSWQSSGILKQGNCPGYVSISDCYSLFLSGDPSQHQDPGGRTPRQRIEFLSPGFRDGEVATFRWKSFLNANVTTTNQFFHLMQIFSRGDDGPVLTLDAKLNRISILDPINCPSYCGKGTSMDLRSFSGRTIIHAMRVKFGPKGFVEYAVGDAQTNKLQIGYTASGINVGSQSTSIKFGTYRAAVRGMGASLAYIGDYRAQKQ